jgi:hypothetical protein
VLVVVAVTTGVAWAVVPVACVPVGAVLVVLVGLVACVLTSLLVVAVLALLAGVRLVVAAATT